jgi:hypothetical protein
MSMAHRPEPFSNAELVQIAAERRRVMVRGMALIWLMALAGPVYLYFATDDAPFAVGAGVFVGLACAVLTRFMIGVYRRTTPSPVAGDRPPIDVDRVGPELEAALERVADRERFAFRVALIGGSACLLFAIGIGIVFDEAAFAVLCAVVLVANTWTAARGLRTLDSRVEKRRHDLREFLARERLRAEGRLHES